jgi:hypothetical protein
MKINYWIIILALALLSCESTQDKRVQEEAQRNGREIRDNINRATGGNTSIQDVYPEVNTVHVNSKQEP